MVPNMPAFAMKGVLVPLLLLSMRYFDAATGFQAISFKVRPPRLPLATRSPSRPRCERRLGTQLFESIAPSNELRIRADGMPATKRGPKPGGKYTRRGKYSWDVMYPRLMAFYKAHGHSKPGTADPELNKWVMYIKARYKHQVEGRDPYFSTGVKRPLLTPDKLAALEAIQFRWDTNVRDSFTCSWDVMFPRIQEYYEKNGHSNVPIDEDREICHWIKTTRTMYRHQVGQLSSYYENGAPRRFLRPEKLEALNSIDFPWEMAYSEQKAFEEMLDRLKEFRAEHGHVRPTKKQDIRLRNWCYDIRNHYRWQITHSSPYFSSGTERSSLTVYELDALDEADFPWFAFAHPNQHAWEDMVIKLHDFFDEYGHTDVPLDYQSKSLMGWVHMIRHKYRHQVDDNESSYFLSGKPRPRLTAEQLDDLEHLEFDWKERPKSKFETMLDRLKQFREEYSHTYVPQKVDKALNTWIRSTRSDYSHQVDGSSPYFPSGKKRPVLPDDQLRALNEAGFPWEPPETSWDSMFPRLQAFREEHGHLNVSPKDDEELARWIKMTRALYKQVNNDDVAKQGRFTPLPKEKLEALEKLSFPWDG